MSDLKSQARTLRLKGFSYNEINKSLKIPKSTLSGWFSDLNISKKAKSRLKARVAQGTLHGLIKRNRLQTKLAEDQAKKIIQIAEKEIGNLDKEDLFFAGIFLYWAEGYKRLKKVKGREVTNHPIGFTNSDEVMIKIFISFLTKIMGIKEEKIVIELRIFKDQEREKVKAIKHWSKAIKLPEKNFRSVSTMLSISSLRKRPFNRLPFGTASVRVCDTKSFYRLMGWISGVKKSLENLY